MIRGNPNPLAREFHKLLGTNRTRNVLVAIVTECCANVQPIKKRTMNSLLNQTINLFLISRVAPRCLYALLTAGQELPHELVRQIQKLPRK